MYGGFALLDPSLLKESTYCWNIASVYRKKSRFAWSGAAWNRWVMWRFHITPASKRWLGWRKTENPRGNRLCWCCETYCTVILRYFFASRVISDVLWSSCFESYGPKDTRQAQMTLVSKLHLHIPHNAPYLPPKILHRHCFQSLLKRL